MAAMCNGRGIVDLRDVSKQYRFLKYRDQFGFGEDEFCVYAHDSFAEVINNAIYEGTQAPKFVDDLLAKCRLLHKVATLSCMRPGNILPPHRDKYTRFRADHVVTDVQRVVRIVVFLEDSAVGHMIQVRNEMISSWSAGEYVYWTGDTIHAAYNFSSVNRYTLQITGEYPDQVDKSSVTLFD